VKVALIVLGVLLGVAVIGEVLEATIGLGELAADLWGWLHDRVHRG